MTFFQAFSPAERFATGLRHAEGFGIDTAGSPDIRDPARARSAACELARSVQARAEVTSPAEDRCSGLTRGGDLRWPQNYYDPAEQALVLAPEYGGDGGKRRGATTHKLSRYRGIPRSLGAGRHGVL